MLVGVPLGAQNADTPLCLCAQGFRDEAARWQSCPGSLAPWLYGFALASHSPLGEAMQRAEGMRDDISECIAAHRAGVAPRHADLQRVFNLTPSSMNSMLVRLERCGFICRLPGKARAVEVLVPVAHLPPCHRPFKF